MSFPLDGKTALVTGASTGIGREIARELAACGATVAIAARTEPALVSLADEVAGAGKSRPVVLPADLTRRGAAAELAGRAQAALGGVVDVLVNNAALGVAGPEYVVGDGDAARELFEVNLWSALALIQALVPPMRARGAGAVVNLSSLLGAVPFNLIGYYAMSKAALSQATETLRLELRGSGVHVVHVAPGRIDTPMLAEFTLVLGSDGVFSGSPLGDPRELARRVVRAVVAGRRQVVYPRVLTLTRAVPTLSTRLVDRFSKPIDPATAPFTRSGSQGDPAARAAREAFLRRQAP